MKMYKQPQTEVMTVNTEHLMDNATLSPGGPGTGQMEAPRRRGTPIE